MLRTAEYNDSIDVASSIMQRELVQMSKDHISLQSKQFALLIDADNTSIDLFPHIMKQVETWGKVTIRQIYGNQECLLNQKWKDACLRYALQPILHIGISGAKNATDIALTVGAMDLLYKEATTSFCLVTGDQDFTALVLRLRSQGCQVYCIGRSTKAEALAKVCTEFIPVVQLSAQVASSPQKNESAKNKVAQPKAPTQKNGSSVQTYTSKSHLDPALTLLLTKVTDKIASEKKLEWISLPRLGSCLKQLDPQFQAKTYGQKNLPELVKTRTDLFEMRQQGDHLEVRLKAKKRGK